MQLTENATDVVFWEQKTLDCDGKLPPREDLSSPSDWGLIIPPKLMQKKVKLNVI